MNDVKIEEATFDLNIVNGDFSSIESTEQHLQFLLLASKGEWREIPQAGIGIIDYLNTKNNTTSQLKREIQVQSDLDGFRPSEILIDLPAITIKGNY